MENNLISGLRIEQKDENDLHLGLIETLPELSELPYSFDLGDTPINDQRAEGNDDFCGGYGSVGMAYLQDGVEGCPEWVFAAGKEITGSPRTFGLDMRTIFSVWTKYGSPRKSDVKIPEKKTDRRILTNYERNLRTKAVELLKETYVTCKGQYDAFDNIRASIWKYRAEKRAVGIGLRFSWNLTDIYLNGTSDRGFPHFMFAKGFDGEYLIVPNSYGLKTGKKGVHYVSRETINKFIPLFGGRMMIDMPFEEARKRQCLTLWRRASIWGKIKILIGKHA